MKMTKPFLIAAALCLFGVLPSLASTQCAQSDADPTIWIETADLDEATYEKEDEFFESDNIEAFRIAGIRPQRVQRLGLHRWDEGIETPQQSRPGFSSACQPFEYFLVVSVRPSPDGSELMIQYRYYFEEHMSQSEVTTLKRSNVSRAEIQSIRSTSTLASEEDGAIWGVFVGAVPEAGESLEETARRSDRALLLHVRNSHY